MWESYQNLWGTAKAIGGEKHTLENKILMCLLFNSDATEVENESKERQKNSSYKSRKQWNRKRYKNSTNKSKSYFFLNSLHKSDLGKEIHNIRNEMKRAA